MRRMWAAVAFLVLALLTPSDASAQSATAPDAPAAPTLTAGDGQIGVVWSAPSDNGSPITDYDVQYRQGNSGIFTSHAHNGTGRAATISGLTNGTSYQVQVRAVNAIGDGAWSPSASATPEAVTHTVPHRPNPPSLRLQHGGVVFVTFEQPLTGGSAITAYNLRRRTHLGDQWTTFTLPSRIETRTMSGLTEGLDYELQVRAVNAQGSGPWSYSAIVSVPLASSGIASVALPEVALLHTATAMELTYATDDQDASIHVRGDGLLRLRPDCLGDGNVVLSFSPPPRSLPVYPCGPGTGSIEVRYGTESAEWVRKAIVIQPLYHFEVTITAAEAASKPDVTWRGLSWQLYRDGLIDGRNVVVHNGIQPLNYQEPGEGLATLTVLTCPDGTCATGTTLWSDPPLIGDQAIFASDEPIALIDVAMQTEGQGTWALTWEYGTASGWEPITNMRDGTEGLRRSGPILWDELTGDRPMAPKVVSPLTNPRYAIRATLASVGTGQHTRPTISTAGGQTGLWSTTLEDDLAESEARSLQVYIVPETLSADYRRQGPSMSTLILSRDSPITTEVSPWRPWSPTAPPYVQESSTTSVSLPPDVGEPIGEDGGLPLIGFAVDHASKAADIPALFLWTLISTGIAFAAMVFTHRATGNIAVSVIAGGLVLVLMTAPAVRLGAVWVVMVYSLIASTPVIIGPRLQT